MPASPCRRGLLPLQHAERAAVAVRCSSHAAAASLNEPNEPNALRYAPSAAYAVGVSQASSSNASGASWFNAARDFGGKSRENSIGIAKSITGVELVHPIGAKQRVRALPRGSTAPHSGSV